MSKCLLFGTNRRLIRHSELKRRNWQQVHQSLQDYTPVCSKYKNAMTHVTAQNLCHSKYSKLFLQQKWRSSNKRLYLMPSGLNTVPFCCFHNSSKHHSRPLTDPENRGQSQEGVNFDTLGSWNNRIDMPILMEQSIKTGKLIPKLDLHDVSHCSLIGRRKTNEDRCDIRELTPDLMYFAIFDGHGGPFAVDFVCNNLVDHIMYWYQRTNKLSEVLEKSFLNINNLICRHVNHYFLDTDMYNSGTTATVCLLRNSIELVVGHVGDSRAVLCRSGEAVCLTKEDSPEDASELERIKKLGGHIVYNSLGQPQVNGRLAMTRSLGDVELEKYGVISTPHIRSIEVKHGKDAFLVLATDGVNFVLSNPEIVNLVSSCPSPKEAANSLVDQALHFGSEDNSTSMVIPFGAWGKYRDADSSMPYSFGRNLFGTRYG